MKFIKALLLVIVAAVFTGCGNYVEEIHLKEDGSGSYKLYTDMVPGSIEMAVQMTMMFSKMDSTKVINEDSLRVAVAEKVWEDFPATVDSTFDVTSEVPEEVKSNPEHKKYIDNSIGFMTGGRDSGFVNAGMKYSFSSVEDFQGFVKFVGEMQNTQSAGNNGPGAALSKTKVIATYSSNKKSFSRQVKFENPQDMEDESLDKLTEMLGSDGTYQTVIITERKIKKVHGKNVKKVEDYKVILEYDFMEALTGNANLDFEIIFD